LVFRAWNTNFGEAEINSASETGARAEKQLDRVLGFFPRVEAKASFLFALDVGLLVPRRPSGSRRSGHKTACVSSGEQCGTGLLSFT
jgi:hypothetical protein